MLRTAKSLWSYNPIPNGCALYLPLWSPGLNGLAFKSADSYRHECAVTGATLKATGRLFNNSSDNIQVIAHTSFVLGTSDWTWIVWLEKSAQANDDYLLSMGGTGSYALRTDGTDGDVRIYFEGEADIVTTSTDYYVANTAVMISIVRSGNDCLVYKDDALKSTHSNTMTTGNNATSDILYVGNSSAGSVAADGTIGEVYIYNTRALSLEEIKYMHSQTRGRYA